MVALVVHMQVQPGTEAECKRLIALMEEHTRKEQGCLRYLGLQSTEDPTRFAFYEEYTSESALHLHWNSEHFRKYVKDGLDKIVVNRQRHLLKPATE